MRKFTFLLLVLLLFYTGQALAQRTISGKVTDDKGDPISNVSVVVKGSTTGTTTNADGTYSLIVPANAGVLVFSSVDMVTQETNIGSSSTISVKLSSKTSTIDEVIVVAYGTVKKEALTGSVGTIKAAAIEKRPINNITAVIEGLVPGVITTSANGQPGAGVSIRVRGFGSINATSEPLLVVDGIAYVGGTSNISPDDVETITVLKDAASTAIYGSRAANGVLLITTKKGKKGRNAVSLKLMQGIATRGLEEYERVDAFEYYPVMWEGLRNSLVFPASGTPISMDIASQIASGLLPRFTSGPNAGLQNFNGAAFADISQLLAYNPFNVASTAIVDVNGQLNPNAQLIYPDDLDWTTDLMRNGDRKDLSINFSGGSDKSDYFFSAGYAKTDGYTVKTDFERFSARLNVNIQPLGWLKTGLNISGNYSVSSTAADGSSTTFVNPFFFSRNIGPIYPVYAHNMTTGDYVLDADGERIYDLGNFGTSAIGLANGIPNRPSGGFSGRHALAETVLNDPYFRRTVASARNYAEISFLKDFKFTNNISVDFQTQNNSSFENTLVGDGAPAGRLTKSSGSTTAFVANQLLNYGKKIGDHRIDALAGHESYSQFDTDLNGFKQGLTIAGITELGNFTTINSVNSTEDHYRIESFFSRINYDYQNKYFVSASIRRDGNSRFHPDSRWGTFWSVGGGWNLNRENFLNTIKWIDVLKLRSSYGVVGVADGIGFYAFQSLYVFSNNANEPGIVQSQSQSEINRELTWEDNKQFDIGIDFSLFKNRISGSIEYYDRVSADLLFAIPQGLSTGVLTVTQNTATMYNRGIEVQLSIDIIRTKDFTWNMNVNASTVANKITKMPEAVPEFINGTKKFAKGQSIFDYWLPTYYGVDPADGSALYLPINKTTASNRRIITNKDGGLDTVTTAISNGQFAYQGGVVPDFYGSLSPSFRYKQITLSALFVFQVGGKTYDGLYQALMSVGNYGGALHTDILDRWQQPGDVTNVPRMDAGRATNFNANSSRWLTNASFLNIRALNLSYDLPQSILPGNLRITNAQFFVSAENVAFFSKRKGMNNQQAFSGVTSNAYPPARIITAGLSLNF